MADLRFSRHQRKGELATWLTGIGLFAAVVLGQVDASQDSGQYRPIPAERADAQTRRTIFGNVVDEDGRPVSDARVRATALGETATPSGRESKTGEDGGFSFEEVKPDGWWSFEVVDDRFASSRGFGTACNVPARPSELPIKLTVYRPRSLAGVVVDEAGKPVADVKVILVREVLPDGTFPQPNSSTDLETTRTDANGQFQMSGLRPGRVHFFLDKPGFARTMTENVAVGGGDVRLLIQSGLRIQGRVVSDGKPLSDVTIRAHTMALSRRSFGEFQTETDRDGGFSFDAVTDLTRYEFSDGYLATVFVDDARWHSKYVRVYKNSDGTVPKLEIEATAGTIDAAQRNPEVVGSKDDAMRTKAAGMPTGTAQLRVTIPPRGDGPHDFIDVQLERSGEVPSGHRWLRGRRGESIVFNQLPAGKYVVTGTATENPHFGPSTVEVEEGRTVDVALAPGPCRLVGTVRDAAGPVKPLTVRLDKVSPYVGPFSAFAAVRDPGDFEFVGLSEGKYELVVWIDQSVSHRVPVTLAGPLTKREVTVPSGSIAGRLVGIDIPERGQMGKCVNLARRESPLAGGHLVPVANDQTFQLRYVPAGTYTFTANDGLRSVSATVTLSRDDEAATVELNANAPTGWVGGRLTGLVEAGVDVSRPPMMSAIWIDDRGVDLSRWTVGSVQVASGAYEIVDLAPGRYWIVTNDPRRNVPPTWLGEAEVRPGLVRMLDGACTRVRAVAVHIRSESTPHEPTSIRIRLPGAPGFLPVELWGWSKQIPDGRSAGLEGKLAVGDYEFELSVGDAAPVVRAFTVEPGAGIQEITIVVP